jgi:enoyl-CoA hydratase
MPQDAPAADASLVLLEDRGKVRIFTLNRPAQKNAVNGALSTQMAALMDAFDADPAVSVGVLTGAGGTFSAGMDLKAFLAGESPFVPGRGFGGLAERPPEKPLIAAIEGYALAGGLELALACDLLVAAENAKLGIPEVKRSLVAAAGAAIRLPKRIPYHLAMEMALTGDFYPARRCAELGLVNRVTEPGKALDAALELAQGIAKNGPLGLVASKKVMAGSAGGWTEAEAWQKQREIVDPVFASEDAKEGAAAFAEKRAPVWQGK